MDIPLHAGWNLISLSLRPATTNVAELFAPIASSLEVASTWDTAKSVQEAFASVEGKYPRGDFPFLIPILPQARKQLAGGWRFKRQSAPSGSLRAGERFASPQRL